MVMTSQLSVPLLSRLRELFPGFAVSALVAATAQFLSEHYGAPAMLMALLLGLALNFLAEEGTKTAPGISMTARSVLRLGVALLGARISVEMLARLGWPLVLLVVACLPRLRWAPWFTLVMLTVGSPGAHFAVRATRTG